MRKADTPPPPGSLRCMLIVFFSVYQLCISYELLDALLFLSPAYHQHVPGFCNDAIVYSLHNDQSFRILYSYDIAFALINHRFVGQLDIVVDVFLSHVVQGTPRA